MQGYNVHSTSILFHYFPEKRFPFFFDIPLIMSIQKEAAREPKVTSFKRKESDPFFSSFFFCPGFFYSHNNNDDEKIEVQRTIT